MTTLDRRRVLVAGCGLLALPRARAATYPTKSIRLVVPFPPGGPTDIVARPIAQLLGTALAQQVYIDNRGGAGGSIGADVVAKSPADGYTLLMATVGTAAINPALYKSLPYDPIADFTPVATVASAPVAVVVHPRAGIDSLKALVEQARSKPGFLTYGSAGNGTPGHLAAEMFCATAGIKLTHVPYKGSAPGVSDLLGGQIPLMFDPLQSVLTHVQAGKLTALAVTSRERAPLLPQVPTVAESGWPGYETIAWWAVYGPARLPADVTQRLHDELTGIVRSPDFQRRLAEVGLTALDVPLAAFQKSEAAKWGAAVRNAGITIE